MSSASSGTAADPEPISSLGRYVIYRKLSEGGMGELFLATNDGRPCVLKTVRAAAARDPVVIARFDREAHVGSRIRHPNVGRVERYGHEDGVFCIEMELVRGRDLHAITADLLRAERLLPYPVSVTAVCEFLEGLDYVHRLTGDDGKSLNIVHRDLSLRNLMLAFDGTAKIIDFGVARATIDDFRTLPGSVVGTVRFLSPELARGEVVDHRSDVYSLGAVLYELLTGAAVVQSSANRLAMMRAVVEDTPAPPTQVNPEVPEALGAVVMRALEKGRDQRWQTAAEFRDALRSFAPTWAEVPRGRLATFLRTWFSREATQLNDLVAAIETRRARDAALNAVAEDELTIVRPMSGFEEVEERVAGETGLIFPPRSRVRHAASLQSGLRTPDDRLLVSSAAIPRSIGRRGAWKAAAATLAVSAAVGIGVLLRSGAEVRAPVANRPVAEPNSPRPVTAVQAKPVDVEPATSAPPSQGPRMPALSRPGTPRPSAPPPEPVAPATPSRPPTKLANLLGRLERSPVHPLGKDPAFAEFVDEVTNAAAQLPDTKRRLIVAQLDLFIDSGEVQRARAIVASLEAR